MTNLRLVILWILTMQAVTSNFTHHVTVTRTIPSVDAAVHRFRQGWTTRDNLGFPWYIPKTWIKVQGDPTTRVGLITVRPPSGLLESIVDFQEYDDHTTLATYKVLNPGWFTWPVQDHQGTVRFRPGTTNGEPSSVVEWTIHWIPLKVPIGQSIYDAFVASMHQQIATWGTDYLAQADPDMPNTKVETEKVEAAEIRDL